MTFEPEDPGATARDLPATHYLAAPEILLVLRPRAPGSATPFASQMEEEAEAAPPDEGPVTGELYLAIDGTGAVTAFNGHVDLGTGIRTALAQIVADELDVPYARVTMVLGSTAATPDQGATLASETMQFAATPLRRAAATARRHLLAVASERLGIPESELTIAEGIVSGPSSGDRGGNAHVALGELVAGGHVRLAIDPAAPLKAASEYRVVGRSQPRVDIPAKAAGIWTYVHDVRVPGMLHGRVVRPPYAGFDSGPHVGSSLVAVDEGSVAHIPGVVAVVVIRDFVGIVATREENAVEAARVLKTTWRDPPAIPDLNAPEAAIRNNPATARRLVERGDVERALASAAKPMASTYVWPYQMHGSIGPSCAVAEYGPPGLTVWSGTQNPFPLRADLARLMALPEESVIIERLEAAGCYGRNCADDVSADAALLSRAVGRPVRVQLSREQEHAWEPKGAAQVIDVRGGLDLEGGPAGYDFETRYPSNLAPTLALILTGIVPAGAVASTMGDRTAVPPYAYGHLRVTVHDMPPLARAAFLRGVSALPNSFAHESFIDELAIAADIDPIAYRLRYLTEPRAVDLVRAVAEKAAWVPHSRPGSHGGQGDILHGRGFAYAVYVHGPFPGVGAAWAAWVADVAVNRVTGEVAVTRIVAGHDAGLMINPAGVRHQIHGNVIQSTSRVLKESVGFSATGVSSREWGAYPILTFPELPEIETLLMERPDEPPLGAGESASIPSAAAITNALFDATGVRFRELPLTPERVRAALNPLPPPGAVADAPAAKKRRAWFGGVLSGLLAGGLALGTVALPWRAAIAPVPRPDSGVFSTATLERGRLAAAAGSCNVCHAGPDGRAYAGGRPIATPFGTVYASNITPDAATGVGAWSYPAFARAMREGVSRDGHLLYPAHPYPSFAGAEEADLQALYAYLMSGAPAANRVPATALAFPFNLRPLMAAWNALFLPRHAWAPDPARDAMWNRGAYLVETLGHCGACHSPRNALGAESGGARHLGGGLVEGWEAPALSGPAAARGSPVGWTAQALYEYLRTGSAAHHGSAAGPMSHVVESLAPLPDADISAMAAYLASLDPAAPSEQAASEAARAALAASEAASGRAALAEPRGARLFEGACAACHGANGALTPLALNRSLHAGGGDTLLQAVLQGVAAPAHLRADAAGETTAMPSFADTLSDPQITDLARYLRARFAPDQPAWDGLERALTRARRVAGG